MGKGAEGGGQDGPGERVTFGELGKIFRSLAGIGHVTLNVIFVCSRGLSLVFSKLVRFGCL